MGFLLLLGLLILASAIAFLVGLVMVFTDATRKKGLKLMLIAIIGLVIGFGGCGLFPLRL